MSGGLPDLTLPEKVPEIYKYRHERLGIMPLAFYALCDLDSKTMEAYRRLCTTDLWDDAVKLPPQSKFLNKTLRDVVKYHVELAEEGQFSPTYFIVCVYEDARPVLVVTLSDDDGDDTDDVEHCRPDLFWINMEESGSTCCSFQIGKISWCEAKDILKTKTTFH